MDHCLSAVFQYGTAARNFSIVNIIVIDDMTSADIILKTLQEEVSELSLRVSSG